MNKFFKRLMSWSAMVAILSLNFSSTAFALSATKKNDISSGSSNLNRIFDSVTDDNGDIHAIGLEYSQSDADLHYFYYDKSDGVNGTWYKDNDIEAGIDTTGNDDSYDKVFAQIALDSSGNPGVSYMLMDTNGNTGIVIKYRQYGGSGTITDISSNWDAVRTIDTIDNGSFESPLEHGAVVHGLAFDGSNPTIMACDMDGSDETYVQHYTTSNDFASVTEIVDADNTVFESGDYGCSTMDFVIDDGGDYYAVLGNASRIRPVKNTGSGWALDGSDLDTSVGTNNNVPVRMAYDAGADIPAVVWYEYTAGSNNDNLMFADRDGSWGSGESLVSDADVDDSLLHFDFEFSIDATEGNPHIAYWDDDNVLKVRYLDSDGESWTGDTVNTYASGDGNEMSITLAADNDTEAEINLISMNSLNADPWGDLDHWYLESLTDLGGGGGGVPEFSTYVYVATLLLMFGLMYKQMEPNGVFVKY